LLHPHDKLHTNPPFNSSVNWGAGRPLDSLASPLPSGTEGTPSAAAALDYKNQGSYQWNLTIERELFKDTKVEVSYVGNRGHHLPINWDLNYVPSNLRAQFAREAFTPDGPDGQELRLLFPLKGTSSLIHQTNVGNSSYNALQVQFTKRFAQGFSYQASYTWSKLLALTDINCCGSNDNTRLSDPENPKYDRGLATFDRTHILTMNGIYKLPLLTGRRPMIRAVLGGWEGTGIYQYATGVPLTVTLGNTLAGIFANRPDIVGNASGAHTANEWLNPNAFALPSALGALGTASKGVDRAPAINNLDLALYRNFPIREGMTIQFRAEFFNVLNHTQFLNINTGFSTGAGTNKSGQDVEGISIIPNTNRIGCQIRANGQPTGKYTSDCNTNATFGLPTRARDPREIQFGIKFNF
jgi:hypothetical protein